MKRSGIAVLIALAGLFMFISVAKLRAPGGSGDTLADSRAPDSLSADSLSAAKRQEVLRFWEIYREATDHRMAGRVGEAADAYASALELNPDHQDALYYLGSMQLELGRFAAAERSWQHLAEVNPLSGRAHSRLAALYSCLEPTGLFDAERAGAEYERALELNQEQTGPRLGLAELALARGDLNAAERYLDQVLGSDASSVEAHYLRGFIAWKRGDRDAAASWFRESVELARPAEPAGGVAGEGDTRAGSRPLLASTDRCRRTLVDRAELRSLAAETSQAAQAHYSHLDAQLANRLR